MRCLLACFLILILVAPELGMGQEKKEPKVTYEDHVKPIFRQHCFSCHNQNKKEGDLDLTNYTSMMDGGGSGSVIEPGAVNDSYLFGLVNHDEEPAMPPEQPKIDEAKIATLSKWIEMGALENVSSKANIKKKKSFDFALSDPAVGKPSVMPLPAKLDLQPVVVTKRSTGVTAMATSPWAPLTAIAGQKQILLYDSKTRELKGVFPFPEGVVSVLKFSRNGSLLLAGGGRGGASGKVIVWNIKNGERIIEVGDELDTVLAADISSDQKLIALGGPQRMIRVYSTADNSLVYEVKKHTDWVTSLEFSPDGVLLATGDRNGGVHVWEAFSGREYLTLKAHSAAITGISWRSDSNIVATTSEDASIRLWEMNNGSQVKSWTAHGGGSQTVEFTRDGRLVSCGRDKYCKIWDQAGKQLFAFPPFNDIAMSATHCDESNLVVAGDWTGELRQFNAADGKLVSNLTSNPETLENRLGSAQQQLTAVQATSKTAVAKSTAAKASLDQINAAIAAEQKKVTDTEALLKTATAKLATDQKTLQTLTAQVASLKNRLDILNAAVPELTKAQSGANAAVAKLPADAELKTLAASVSKLLAARTAEQKQKTTEYGTTNTQRTALATAVDATQKQMAAYTVTVTAAKQMLATLQPKVKPAQDAYAAAKAAADAELAKVAQANAEVSKWNNAIQFSKVFRELKSRLNAENEELVSLEIAQAEMMEQAEKAEAGRAQMESVITKTQTELQQKNEVVKKHAATIQSTTAALNAAKAKVVATTNLMKQATAALPLVQEAQQKMVAAQKLSPSDAELKASVDAINATVAGQQKRLESLKAQLATENTQVATAQTQLASLQKMMVEAKAAADSLTAKMAADKKILDQATAAANAAKTSAAEAEAKVQQKSSVIVTIKEEVSKLQGIQS